MAKRQNSNINKKVIAAISALGMHIVGKPTYGKHLIVTVGDAHGNTRKIPFSTSPSDHNAVHSQIRDIKATARHFETLQAASAA
jgi:hypothetical protein